MIELGFIIGIVIVVGIGLYLLLIRRPGKWLDKELKSDRDYFKEHPEEVPYVESPEEREARLKHEALVEKFYYELGTEEEKKEWEKRKKREAEEAKKQERRKKEWERELARREKEKEENLKLFQKAHGSVMFGDYISPYSVCSVTERFMSGIYSCRI